MIGEIKITAVPVNALAPRDEEAIRAALRSVGWIVRTIETGDDTGPPYGAGEVQE